MGPYSPANCETCRPRPYRTELGEAWTPQYWLIEIDFAPPLAAHMTSLPDQEPRDAAARQPLPLQDPEHSTPPQLPIPDAKLQAQQPAAATGTTPPQQPPPPIPDSGDETETSWPDEDRPRATGPHDATSLMQRLPPSRRNQAPPASSTSPSSSTTPAANQAQLSEEDLKSAEKLVRALQRLLQDLLHRSFTQSNPQLTDLAYLSAFYLDKLAGLQQICPLGGDPGDRHPRAHGEMEPLQNILLPVEKPLTNLEQNHRNLPDRDIFQVLDYVSETIVERNSCSKHGGRTPEPLAHMKEQPGSRTPSMP